MARGGKSRLGVGALGLLCLLATMLIAAPAPASAASGVDEYSLNLPDGGSGGSSGAGDTTTTAPVPTTPAYPTTTTPTTVVPETPIAEVGGVEKKRRKPPQELAPLLSSSSANAELGPEAIPPLRISDDGGGLPIVGVLLALLAAACCLLAIWRLRFLRELPAAPRRRATRGAV